MPVTIRPMTVADLPFAMRLKEQAGWNQLEADWKRFLDLEPGGCFVAEVDRRPAGTGVVVTYGRQLAWIGMIIVDETQRRHGVGRAVMAACMDYCRAHGVAAVKLDATPAGNRLYLGLGFVEEYLMDRRQGHGGRFDSHGVAPLTADRLDEVVAMDAANFGAARPAVLGRLIEEFPAFAFTADDASSRLVGFLLARRGSNAWQIGPWQADTPAVAEQLLRAALNAIGEQPVFFDVLGPNRDVLPLASKYGFVHQRPFVRMYLGANPCPGRPERTYAISGVEKG